MTEAISIKKVYDEIKKMETNMVTKKDMESLIDTIEVMGNPQTMQQIAKSMQDIKAGRTKEVNSVKDMLNE